MAGDGFEVLPTFDIAGVPPELNICPIYGSFKTKEPMETSQQVAEHITAYLRTHVECPFDETEDFDNLDAAGPVSSQIAEDVLVRIASHNCAYGGTMAGDTAALAHATFISMQGGSLDTTAVWYATTDIEVCQTICNSFFSSPYIGDWISFLVICIRGDRRTCSVLLGADTD